MFSLCLAALLAFPAQDLALKDGDRIVMVGGALIEREQQYSYVELMLHRVFPDKKFTVRNLGWSGDTVWGEARAEFGTQADGYKKLVEQVKACKPTVLILGYGTNEAYAGKESVAKFSEQYRKLMKDIVPEGCKLIFLTIPHPIHPRLSKNFASVEYDTAIRTLAQEKHALFVDINKLFEPTDSRTITDDGILPNALGYQKLAGLFAFQLIPDRTSNDWNPSLTPEASESMRQLILKKNELFFHQYRPQNDTYLFLFRKHEQGNNAVEIPKFTPLIEELDKQINELKQKK